MKAVLVLALAACAFALTYKNDPNWIAYKQQFNKVYSAAEEVRHYAIFNKKMAKAAELNKIDRHAKYGWTKFSDIETHRPLLKVPDHIRRTHIKISNDLPDSLDWREKGAVTGVKDQEQCGSCWAFSTVVACEGAYFLEHNQLISLSEQQIVDCDDSNNGCDGGWPIDALGYVQQCGGLEGEDDYPYTAYQGQCQFDPSLVKMQVSDVQSFQPTEYAIQTAVQQYGPISICLDATKFDYYSGGIMDENGCTSGYPDHAVAIVGWGSEDGTNYWIVKNSWGADWGEDGYVRILRGVDACGVEDYPVGATAA